MLSSSLKRSKGFDMKARWPLGVHLVGIGGIGMSSLAQVLLKKGVRVTGSDMSRNANVERLSELGAIIFNEHAASNVGDVSLVVVSTAVSNDNPECGRHTWEDNDDIFGGRVVGGC